MPLENDSYKALLSGHVWLPDATPMFITYSFPLDPGTSYSQAGFKPSLLSSLAEEEKEIFRDALSIWSKVAGVRFLEVDGNSHDIKFSEIRVSNYDFEANHRSDEGFGFYPAAGYGGDVLLKPNMGDGLLHVALHEIGHALGLKHPFEALAGRPVLDSKYCTTEFTVMAYEGDRDARLGPLDLQAAQFLYGPSNLGGLKFSWDAVNDQMKVVGTDKGERVSGSTVRDFLQGGDGNDVLSGEMRNDTLVGGKGNDSLHGGMDSDLFVFKHQSGKDNILDYSYADHDKLIFDHAFGVHAIGDLKIITRPSEGISSEFDVKIKWDGGRILLDHLHSDQIHIEII